MSFKKTEFKTSSFCPSPSCPNPPCVEVAIKDGEIGVRDSKDPNSPTLVFNESEWAAFLSGVKAGEFDI